MEKTLILQTELTEIEVQSLLSTVQRCAPIFETLIGLSFRPAAPLDQAWEAWCAGIVSQNLIRDMQEIYEHAVAGHVREVADCDRRITAQSGEEIPRLCSEGRRLLLSYHPPKSERVLEKFSTLVRNEESPAHFAVVYTLRGAAFHVPLPMVIKSYVFLEALLGARMMGARQPELLLERFLQVAQTAAAKDLRAA